MQGPQHVLLLQNLVWSCPAHSDSTHCIAQEYIAAHLPHMSLLKLVWSDHQSPEQVVHYNCSLHTGLPVARLDAIGLSVKANSTSSRAHCCSWLTIGLRATDSGVVRASVNSRWDTMQGCLAGCTQHDDPSYS